MKRVLVLLMLELVQVLPVPARPALVSLSLPPSLPPTLPPTPALSLPPSPTDSTAVFKVYYYVDHSDLDVTFMQNSATLKELDNLLDSLMAAGSSLKVKLVSGASPEGTEEGNKALGEARSQQMRSYLLSHHYKLQERDLTVASNGSDWEGLLRSVERARYYWAPEAARIIRNTPIWVRGRNRAIVDSRKKQLMDLHLGDAWRTMEQDLFPYLRKTEVSVAFPLPVVEPEPKVDTVVVVERQLDTVLVDRYIAPPEPARKHGFLIYTNLLYDATLVPSIGTQIYFGKGWALDARWAGNWLSNQTDWFCWRMYGGELAVRKYLREPQDNGSGIFRSSTGHHFGVYGQIFTLDVIWNGRGYLCGKEGKNLFAAPCWGAGVEYGYTLPLGKHFNLDFSIGAGYVRGPLQEYDPSADKNVRSGELTSFQWWGPTRADITLQWLIGMENKSRR